MIPPAMSQSKVSAISFPGPGENPTPQIRLYYQVESLAIQELCWYGKEWTAGKVLGTAQSASPIASVMWLESDGPHIRVYFQADVIQEYRYEAGQWSPGKSLPVTTKGSLAAVAWFDSSPHIRVFYPDGAGVIQQYRYDDPGGWTIGESVGSAFDNSPMAATMWTTEGPHIRVYAGVSDGYAIQEHCYDDPSGWKLGPQVAKSAGNIAAVSWLTDIVRIRLYYQDVTEFLDEVCDDDGWEPGLLKVRGNYQTPVAATTFSSDGVQYLRVYYAPMVPIGKSTSIREKCAPPAWFDGSCDIPM